jgi:myo-inositol-1(or 4)-monophosphatase
VTDWLYVCREAADAVRTVVADLPTRADREPSSRVGEGGDETTAIDEAAERAVVGGLQALHADGVDFTLVSEELGERRFGHPTDGLVIVVDPIDVSTNAKRGIPFFSLSIAVAEGPAMRDVVFGFVADLGTGEEWIARRGEGAFLDGRGLEGPGPKDEIEILSIEATTTAEIASCAEAMEGFALRLRVMGSLALSLCHLAAARVDAVCSLKPIRSVDIAAAQLLCRERGLALTLPDAPTLEDHPLDLVGRSRIAAAASPGVCADLASRLGAWPRDAA